MNPTTVSRLLDLNRQFYQTFGMAFSLTRQRLQPGVIRLLKQIKPTYHVLDLGCGNGELARQLARGGHTAIYTGVDFSPTLLEAAIDDQPIDFTFLLADLTTPGWETVLPDVQYDLALAFAVLHHIPSQELRLQILGTVRSRLTQGGRFIHSEWQFLNSPRLSARVQPWETAGLSASDVDPGDYLLDWRQGGSGLRYVHHFSASELSELAAQAGFEVVESFLSDGENARLGLYQVWQVK